VRPVGIELPGSVTMAEAARLAAEAEAAGVSSVWIADVRREPYLVSAAALGATTRVTVGTDVAVAFSRSPAATAQAAWDLAAYGGGRFVLGLGSQVGPTLLSRFGVEAERPAARLRDYVRAVRACFDAYRAGRGRYEGEFFRIPPPIFMPLVVGRSREELATQMTTYAVPAYRRVLDESGFKEEADAILDALAERRRADAARIIEGRVLDQLGVVLLEDLAEGVARWRRHAEHVGFSVPWYGIDHAAQVALFRDVLGALDRLG